MTYFPIDYSGFIINTASIDKVQKAFLPLLQEATEQIKEQLEDCLLSVYVRGSVSLGRAFPYSSDLDMIIVTVGLIEESQCSLITLLTKELEYKYPVVTDIELKVISLEKLLYSKSYTRTRIHLVTQALLIHGDDIAFKLQRVKPDRDLALELHPNIKGEFEHLRRIFTGELQQCSHTIPGKPITFWCVWTARVILRSALVLSMITQREYETDLKVCKQNAIKNYPILKPYLEQAYIWALKPTNKSHTLIEYLDSYLPIFLELWHKNVLRE